MTAMQQQLLFECEHQENPKNPRRALNEQSKVNLDGETTEATIALMAQVLIAVVQFQAERHDEQ